MLEKLQIVEQRFDEVSDLIVQPDIISDQKRYIQLNKEYKELSLLVEKIKIYKTSLSNLKEAESLLKVEKDSEMIAMAKLEIESIKIENENLIINGIFDFHGKQIKKTFSASYKNQDSKWIIFGEFQLTPTDFNINLPSFLSIKMEDLLEIKYNIVLDS